MEKSQLQPGMRLVTREGRTYIVFTGCNTKDYGNNATLFISMDGSFMPACGYRENLEHKVYEGWDIIKVYTAGTINEFYEEENYVHICDSFTLVPTTKLYLLWERTNRKWADKEIESAKLDRVRFKYVARDEDGTISLFKEKPQLHNKLETREKYYFSINDLIRIPETEYPSLEPRECVALKDIK